MTLRSSLSGWRLGLALLLAVSGALRFALVGRGGEFFFGDESRYSAALTAWQDWSQGHSHDGWSEVAGTADHLGFKVLGLIPAWIQIHAGPDLRVSAALLSLFSLCNILWIWLIARRTGAGEREAFWAAAAMAASNSMFYWSRHLMPYDLSLFWALACAHAAFHPAPRVRHSLGAGVLGFLAFVTYNGYWALVAVILTAHVLLAWPSWLGFIRRGLLGLIGLGGSFLALLLVAVHFHFYLLPSYLGFAGTITQGDFKDGYVVLFDYLWRAERLTALVWLAAFAAAPFLARRAAGADRRRGLLWVGHLAALVVILIVGSNLLHKFVVYGRLARQLAPFCALLTGWCAGRLFAGGRRRAEGAALAGLLACGAFAMATPFRMEFPAQFYFRARREMTRYQSAHGTPATRFRILYAGYIWAYPKDVEKPLPPHYRVLLRSAHPLAWRPYLYEGFNRDQRAVFEHSDISMRLILIGD